jgi:hypothetical protein
MATKRKTKRFDGETGSEVGRGYEDSNSGMKEAYDADRAAEVAAANKTSDPIEALNRTRGFTKSAPETGEGNYPAEVVEVKKTVEKAAKPAVVTPAQMKAAGFDNLRDYLNDKQGLTRRSESAAKKTVTAAPATPSAKASKMSREESIAQIPTSSRLYSTVGGQSASGSELGRNVDAALAGSGGIGQAIGRGGVKLAQMLAGRGSKAIAEAASTAPYLKELGYSAPRIGREALKIGREPLKIGMKKGGSVSSASRRADGIAQRGKTRI